MPPLTSTFDGVNIGNRDLLLLIGQTDPTQNGVWVFAGATNLLTRPTDSDDPFFSGNTLDNGIVVPVAPGGIQFGAQKWAVNSPPTAPIQVDTTPIAFAVDTLGPAGMTTLTLTGIVNSAVNGLRYGYIEIAGATGAFQITGFSDVTNGLDRLVFNTTPFPMTLKHEDGADEGTPANRIHNPDGCDVVCALARLRYSAALSRWLLVSYEPYFCPLNMRGLLGWWRSDAVSRDATGKVQSAADLSGNGNTVSQATAAQRPTFSASGGPNGRPFWTCTSSTLLQNSTANILPSGHDHTVFAAFQPMGNGGTVCTLRLGAPVNWKGYQSIAEVNYVYSDGTNAIDNATIASMITGSPVIYTGASQVGSVLAMRINGSLVPVLDGGAITSDSGTTGFALLGRADVAGFGLVGQFYEMFVLDHVANAAEIAVAEAYLTQRWQ